MSAGGDSEWVDRSPPQSRAMRAAYKGLADAEAYASEVHDAGDWKAHHEAVEIVAEWHHEIGRIALEGK